MLPKIPEVKLVLIKLPNVNEEFDTWKELLSACSACEIEEAAWKEWSQSDLPIKYLQDEKMFRDFFSDNLEVFIEESGYTLIRKAV